MTPVIESTAAIAALSRQLRWAKRQTSVLGVMLRWRPPEVWRHYPRHDWVEPQKGWQLYWHAHPPHHELPSDWPAEAGHFHFFRRGPTGRLAHLVGLAVDEKGQPLRWFTTNRWVTGGDWMAADAAMHLMRTLRLQRSGPHRGVLGWLDDLLHAYAQPLGRLMEMRDEVLAALVEAEEGTSEEVFEDRRYSVLSVLPLCWPEEVVHATAQDSIGLVRTGGEGGRFAMNPT